MIKIIFTENFQNPLVDDVMFSFSFAKLNIRGGLYSFGGHPDDQAYQDVVNRAKTYYQSKIEVLNDLSIGRSYFWFFNFWDESEEGILVTCLTEDLLQIQFCTKIKYSSWEEYIFKQDLYQVNRLELSVTFEIK
jgi:hypothetical protein